MSESIYDLNRQLINEYGRDISNNLPKFRIVWTSTQKEKRYEEFAVFDESGNHYLRTETGVHEVDKYGPTQQDMWVLERLLPTAGNPYLEMVTKYSYEPVWIFGIGKSDRNPVWRAVKLLCNNALNGGDPNRVNKSPRDLEREEEQRMAKEKELFKTILQDDSPYLAGCIRDGQAVVVPHNYEKRDSNG